jgi:hypothetical protein
MYAYEATKGTSNEHVRNFEPCEDPDGCGYADVIDACTSITIKKGQKYLGSYSIFGWQNCCGIREVGRFDFHRIGFDMGGWKQPPQRFTEEDAKECCRLFIESLKANAEQEDWSVAHLTFTRTNKEEYGDGLGNWLKQPQWFYDFVTKLDGVMVMPWIKNRNSANDIQMVCIPLL